MGEVKYSDNRTDWLIFFVSFIAFVLMLLFADEWFWITLPIMLTYLVKALKVM